MREIKFRVWDTRNKEFIQNFTVYQYGNVASNGEWLPSKEIILQQYTGLKDKNGRDIYEGDIIKFMRGGKERIEVVEWDEESTGWQYARLNPLSSEVIGNIWENLELLSETIRDALTK